MEAGRELDVLVAEKIFNYALDYEFAEMYGGPIVKELRDRYDEIGLLPNYSTDIAAAWQVWNKVSGNGWVIHKTITMGELSYFIFESSKTFEDYQFIGSGDTLPLAICIAALTTVKQH